MTIGIVLHPYGEAKPAGLARIIFALTRAMIEHDHKNQYIIYLKKQPRVMPSFPGNNWHVEILGAKRLWLNRLARAPRSDVYLFNTPVLPMVRVPGKSIVLALDYAYLSFPPKSVMGKMGTAITKWRHARSLGRADKVIAISKATKKDTCRIFRIPEEKISVVYPGYTNICAIPAESMETPEQFFLFVGALKERKNVMGVARAFANIAARLPMHSLVIVGNAKSEHGETIRLFIAQQGLEERVKFLDHISDSQLSYIYKHAAALAFPSFIEGFGFPVLEAMSCGLPVITSNQSSLAELGANGSAMLVDPSDINEIAEAMERLATDQELRGQLIARGHEQVKRFSWEKAAEKMIEIAVKTAEG